MLKCLLYFPFLFEIYYPSNLKKFRVAASVDSNKMSVENLGMCFGPVIFRSGGSRDLGQELVEADKQKRLVAFLIKHRQTLFTPR